MAPPTNTFFTSDHHWFHEKIIEYCNREYPSVEAMDKHLIEAWNSMVPPYGRVYHLGDFAITGYSRRHTKKVEDLLDQLHGDKVLIAGNHDSPAVQEAEGWQSVYRLKTICLQKQRIVLCHYPLKSWQFKAHGSWMLHGHCHGNLLPDHKGPTRGLTLDVGVDAFVGRVRHRRAPIPFEYLRDVHFAPEKEDNNDTEDG